PGKSALELRGKANHGSEDQAARSLDVALSFPDALSGADGPFARRAWSAGSVGLLESAARLGVSAGVPEGREARRSAAPGGANRRRSHRRRFDSRGVGGV